MRDPLVLTKLAPPRTRLEHLDRRELRARLAAGNERLTLLNAPAGYGKTTLLAWWQQADPRRPFAWVSLDEGDADPQRFWSYVGEAVRRAVPDAELGPPGDLPRLINAIRALPRAVVLVLDDYHSLGDSEVHEQLAALLERGPPNLRVVLATRTGLPFPVARLRASLDLVELTCDDLRFSPEEAAVLLNERLALGLGEAEITQLLVRTDGWPAGLYLAGLERSASGHRHLRDYFATEVLRGLSPDDRAFLLRAAVASEVSGPLLDAMLERDGSADTLRRLERTNLVVPRADAQAEWYRMLAIFRELLRDMLAEEDPALIPELHLRASAWYAAQDMPSGAIEHALAAGRADLAGDLIADEWQPFADIVSNTSFAGWLSALPDEQIAADPRLALAAAWTAGWGGIPGSWRDWLARVEPVDGAVALPSGLPSVEAGVALTRAVYSYNDVGAHLDAAREAAALFRDAPGLLTVADGSLGVALYHAGLLTEARAHLAANVDRLAADFAPTLPVALAYLSLTLTGAGEPAEGLRCAETARERSDRDVETRHAGSAGIVALAIGAALRRLHRPADALGELDQAVALLEGDPLKLDLAQARIERGLALFARGRRAAAAVELDQAAAVIAECEDPGAVAHTLRDAIAITGAAPRTGVHLSEREREILSLLPGELSRREIAAALFVSFNTVQTHMRSIYRKLGVSSRSQAVARAREQGLLDP